ncbi:hypothetical protein QQF64_029712 [Cirrhinus molitorella]|uniref:Death domain-containing protein n=1 Tax=Cirrhinus molitorella TaxID=172907 RepID=A0ABR3N1J9_9TELE
MEAVIRSIPGPVYHSVQLCDLLKQNGKAVEDWPGLAWRTTAYSRISIICGGEILTGFRLILGIFWQHASAWFLGSVSENAFVLRKGSPADELDAKEREKINTATDVIVEHLGRKWLHVGRKLGLAPTQLEGIQEKHSRDLEEQVRELITQWMKVKKENARVQDLITALRDCKQNLTADLVEKNLRELEAQ